MTRALPCKLNKHYKKFYFVFQKMGFNCNHGQFLNMNKEWIRWCWGKFCLLCVLILCGFPFRLSQCEDKEGDFINYPKSLPLLFGSFFFMSVSFSHRFPSSVVDLSELCPIHLWQWLCLWYKQSISFTHTVRNLGCCVFFFFQSHFVVICCMCILFLCHKETDPSKR